MAHTNEIIIDSASERSMQSQCGSYQIVGAGEERKMDEKKSTQRSSFFTKRTAMLFFVVACIFLKVSHFTYKTKKKKAYYHTYRYRLPV